MRNTVWKKYFVFISISLWAICLGMRTPEVGTDTKVYISQYLLGTGGYFKEIGFKYLGYFIFKLGINYQGYLIIVSFLNTMLYYIGFKILIKNHKKFYLVMWIFLFNITYLYGSVNILRQSIAGGFILIAFGFLKEKKKILANISLVLGIIFHTTAIFFLPIFYLDKIYFFLSKKQKYMILIFLLILSFLSVKVLLFHPKFYNYYYFVKTNKSFYIKFLLVILLYIYYSELKLKIYFMNIYYIMDFVS